MIRPTPFRLVAAISTVAVLAVTSACGESGTADAGTEEAYTRPVEMVVPFGPGGGADALARALTVEMEGPLGVDIPVANVPGATGTTGLAKLLGDKPGDTMAVVSQDVMTTIVSGAASFALDELRAVCRLQSMPSALMVRKGTFDGAWEGVEEAAARGPLTVATVGTNSVDDIVLGALEEKFGHEFRAVPFSEPSERYGALLSGDVDVMYEQLGDVRQYLESGDFEPVVLIARDVPEDYADVPTVGDLGLPEEIVLPQFRGVLTNADASDAQVAALESACEAAAGTDDLAAFQEEVYADPDSFQGADDFDAFIAEQAELVATQLEAYDITG